MFRNNIDAIHLEKKFFDNLMNSVLNVKGKLKDNVKSALDLVDICSRSELHVKKQGKCHVFIYKLDSDLKDEFFD